MNPPNNTTVIYSILKRPIYVASKAKNFFSFFFLKNSPIFVPYFFGPFSYNFP